MLTITYALVMQCDFNTMQFKSDAIQFVVQIV